MAVYFAQAQNSKAVKIGKSNDPVARVKLLQIGSPEPLKIIYIGYGGYEAESSFHREFSASHLHGEWFSYEPEISTFVREAKEAREYARKWRAQKEVERLEDEEQERWEQEQYDKWVEEEYAKAYN